MRQIIVANIEKQDNHSDYIYKEGHKILKEDSGQRYLCINKIGELHAYKWPDQASSEGSGVFMATDEVGAEGGYPTVDGKKYRICGAGQDFIYTDTDRKDKVYTADVVTKKKVVIVSPNSPDKKEARELLRGIYIELESTMKERDKWGDRP